MAKKSIEGELFSKINLNSQKFSTNEPSTNVNKKEIAESVHIRLIQPYILSKIDATRPQFFCNDGNRHICPTGWGK